MIFLAISPTGSLANPHIDEDADQLFGTDTAKTWSVKFPLLNLAKWKAVLRTSYLPVAGGIKGCTSIIVLLRRL